MPLSGGISGGGGGGYFALATSNRVTGSNAGVGNAADDVFFGGNGAGNGNAGQYNIGIGINAARQAQTTKLIVIGNNASPSNIGAAGSNEGGVIIGSDILTVFAPSAIRDAEANYIIGNGALANMVAQSGIARNVVIGRDALRGISANLFIDSLNDNVVIGDSAGKNVSTDGAATGSVLIGASVMNTLVSNEAASEYCVIVGSFAAQSFNGALSVVIGYAAGRGDNTTGGGLTKLESANDVYIGGNAGILMRVSNSNTIIGAASVPLMTGGNDNVIIGAATNVGAGYNNPPLTNRNVVLGSTAGNDAELSDSIFIGYKAALSKRFTAMTKLFILEGVETATTHGGATPYLYGNLDKGNLMLGNREDNTGPLNRLFGTGAVNNFKIQEGTAPSTAPDAGVSIYVQNTAGVYSLRCIGPGGVAQVLATGL